jgi:hypothetical protein
MVDQVKYIAWEREMYTRFEDITVTLLKTWSLLGYDVTMLGKWSFATQCHSPKDLSFKCIFIDIIKRNFFKA